jgi:hypothetical protein
MGGGASPSPPLKERTPSGAKGALQPPLFFLLVGRFVGKLL